MAINIKEIKSWQNLAEETIFNGLTAIEIKALELQFKPGKDFAALAGAINSMGPRPPYDYWSIVAGRENILKEHLEGNFS